MKDLHEDLRENVDAVVREWERLVREQPWFSLPRAYRTDNLAGVVTGLLDTALSTSEAAITAGHRSLIVQAAEHGYNRREQGIPESLIFTELHLLRQALWYYMVERHGARDRVVDAIMRIDRAISSATNASMWGYHRTEVEALGKWQESIERLAAAVPLPSVRSADAREG